jgi:hypothetical protein
MNDGLQDFFGVWLERQREKCEWVDWIKTGRISFGEGSEVFQSIEEILSPLIKEGLEDLLISYAQTVRNRNS